MLSLSPESSLLVASERLEVRLVALGAAPDSQLLPTPAAQVRQLLAFADEAWTLFAEDEALFLTRVTARGEAISPPVALPTLTRPWLRRCGGGRTAALLGGAPGEPTLELVADGSRLTTQPLTQSYDWILPRAPGAWIIARDRTLWLSSAGASERLLALPDRLLGGGTTFDGRLLVAWIPDALLVIDLRRRLLQQRIHVEAVTDLRLAERNGQVLLRQGDDRLLLVDVRLGKVLWSRDESRPIVDFAIDADAHTIALQLRDGDGELTTRLAAVGDRDDKPTSAPARRPRHQPLPALPARPTPQPLHDDAPCMTPRATPPFHPIFARSEVAPCPPELAQAALREQLAWVALACKRAIATGWDSGRISFAGDSSLPFEHEVAALLDGTAGRATALLVEACAQLAALEARMQATASAPTAPLEQLAREHDLSPRARRILLVVAAPSLRGELARAYAIAANDPARPACDELLVAQLLAADDGERLAIARELAPASPLRRAALVAVGEGTAPFAPLTVPPAVIARLAGAHEGDHLPGVERMVAPRRLAELSLPRRLRLELAAASSSSAPATPVRLVVRGRPGMGRKSLVAALAAESDRDVGLIHAATFSADRDGATRLAALLVETQLRGWVPCLIGVEFLAGDDAAARERLRAVLRTHPGPLALIVQAGATPPLDPGYQLLELELPDEDERVDSWRSALERRRLPSGLAGALATKYRVGPGAVERAVAAVAREPGASVATAALIDAHLLQQRDNRIGAVATRVTRLAAWSSAVLPDDVAESVREFVSRVRHRRTVFGTWGFDRLLTSARGLTALFSGGPGTGKSMVAGIIARELGYELYRIDLSRVLSKWVGETEKNLAAVFDAAEEGEAVLLFDEADSLFAKRTVDVKSSSDRYANLEVNYLLERLDSFEGIAILTTNSLSAIDPAFKRRLSLRLSFPFPDEEMRERLWKAHLPPELPTAGDFDFATLARKYQLSGGYIRNATLRAAFLAAADEEPVRQAHLERAVALEYREVGKLTESGLLE